MSNNNTSQLLPIGTVLHGTYRVVKHLGSGGFGNTYKVEHIKLGKTNAIKEFFFRDICNRDNDSLSVSVGVTDKRVTFDQLLAKFNKEAQRMCGFDNPHIAKVIDLFDENGTSYYVMEYIDGESLSDRLKRIGRLPESEALDCLRQILDALDEVHRNGIYHLDIKPANIMVDKNGTCKLIDFGASKQLTLDGGATTTSNAYTAGYAPNEQMEQNVNKYGPWTDIYALGATLYNLLTNQKPPIPSDIDDDLSVDKHEALPMSGISKRTQKFILRMMAYRYKQRPQSIEEVRALLDDMGDIVDDEKTVIHTSVSVSTQLIPKTQSHLKPDSVQKPAIESVQHKQDKMVDARNIVSSKKRPSKDEIIQDLINNMVLVEGGSFWIGETDSPNLGPKENPTQQITLPYYYIGRTEVTQELWLAVMGNNPSKFIGDLYRPVDSVSWYDCQQFIRELNILTGKKFRLPTEAEWEFAARGGSKRRGCKYAGSNLLERVAWYVGNSDSTTHPVAMKAPNELGLYDMTGNVWEWCQDYYGNPDISEETDKTNHSSDSYRVYRGGSWFTSAISCDVLFRSGYTPSYRSHYLGLRLALSISDND